MPKGKSYKILGHTVLKTGLDTSTHAKRIKEAKKLVRENIGTPESRLKDAKKISDKGIKRIMKGLSLLKGK